MMETVQLMQHWIAQSQSKVTLWPRLPGAQTCQSLLGITPHATLGVLVNETGGVSVADGRIRHFGGANGWDLSIASVNRLQAQRPTAIPSMLVVADDVYGGLFAISMDSAHLCYLPPDDYRWEDLQIGHTAFFHWSLSDKVRLFYKDFQHLGEEMTVPYDQTMSFAPPLWCKNQGESVEIDLISSKNAHEIRMGLLEGMP